MQLYANWNFPTHVKIGLGALAEIGNCCKDLKINQPLIVTDKTLFSSEIVQKLKNKLIKNNLPFSIYSNVDSNPNDINLADGIDFLKSGNFDGIIAFGGGSAIDLGKLIAFMACQKLPVWDFEDLGDNWKKANKNGILPIIAIPTTAGTGSEVGRASVLTDKKNKIKKVIPPINAEIKFDIFFDLIKYIIDKIKIKKIT